MTILARLLPRLALALLERRCARLLRVEAALPRSSAAAARVASRRHAEEIDAIALRARLGLPVAPRFRRAWAGGGRP